MHAKIEQPKNEPAKTSHYETHYPLGKIRMSPLMYGSLRYIATRHANGSLNLTETSELKQTQLRSFANPSRKWITETPDRGGIMITREGKRALKAFEDNDEFFRINPHMDFTSLLNLKLPDEAPARIHPVAERRKRTAA